MKKLIVLLILSQIKFNVLSQGKTLKGVGPDLAGIIQPGYKGKEAQILNSIFKCMNLKYEYRLTPYGRHILEYSKDAYDFVTTVPQGTSLKGYSSDSHLTLFNGVVTSRENKKVETISELKGLNVIAFKGASEILPGLKDIIPKLKSYKETTKQEIQSRLIMAKRVDAVISDSLIFLHHLKRVKNQMGDSNKKVDMSFYFSGIFPSTKFHLQFKNELYQKEFDRCYAQQVENGEIDKQIHDFLLNLMFQVV